MTMILPVFGNISPRIPSPKFSGMIGGERHIPQVPSELSPAAEARLGKAIEGSRDSGDFTTLQKFLKTDQEVRAQIEKDPFGFAAYIASRGVGMGQHQMISMVADAHQIKPRHIQA